MSHPPRSSSTRTRARVERGTRVIYERPGCKGCQYVLTRGEYPDYRTWKGLSDRVGSCEMIHHGDTYKIHLYVQTNFSGQMFEATEDCHSVLEKFHWREIHSCRVQGGWWVFYERPNLKGRQYLLEKGEYRKPVDWCRRLPLCAVFQKAH